MKSIDELAANLWFDFPDFSCLHAKKPRSLKFWTAFQSEPFDLNHLWRRQASMLHFPMDATENSIARGERSATRHSDILLDDIVNACDVYIHLSMTIYIYIMCI